MNQKPVSQVKSRYFIRLIIFAISCILPANFSPKIASIQSDSRNYYIRAIGTNYNQVVKKLRIHFSEKKAMALLYKLEKCTIDLVRVSREIVELSRKMEAKWSQKSV